MVSFGLETGIQVVTHLIKPYGPQDVPRSDCAFRDWCARLVYSPTPVLLV